MKALIAIFLWSTCAAAIVHRDESGRAITVVVDLKILGSAMDDGGNLVIRFAGELDGAAVGFALSVPPKWREHPMSSSAQPLYRCDASLVKLGSPSEALDTALRQLYRLKASDTLFKDPGYDAVTTVTRDSLEKRSITITMIYPLHSEGEASWRFDIAIDIPHGTGSLTTHDQSS
jgi:hypothetical protein